MLWLTWLEIDVAMKGGFYKVKVKEYRYWLGLKA
jgi:hypothetical protein